MYRATLLWQMLMYYLIAIIPYSAIASPIGEKGGNPIVYDGTEEFVQRSATPHDYAGSPMTTGCDVLLPTNPIQIPGQTGQPPCRTY